MNFFVYLILMAWIQSDLDAIEQAIASGARMVQYNDKKVEYNSLKELQAARQMIAAAINGKSRRSRVYAVMFK